MHRSLAFEAAGFYSGYFLILCLCLVQHLPWPWRELQLPYLCLLLPWAHSSSACTEKSGLHTFAATQQAYAE